MKKKIDVYEYMGEILKGVKSGVLITGKDENKTKLHDDLPGEWLVLNGENLFL